MGLTGPVLANKLPAPQKMQMNNTATPGGQRSLPSHTPRFRLRSGQLEVPGAPQKRGAPHQSQKSHAKAPNVCRGGFAGCGVSPEMHQNLPGPHVAPHILQSSRFCLWSLPPPQSNKSRQFYRFPKLMWLVSASPTSRVRGMPWAPFYGCAH